MLPIAVECCRKRKEKMMNKTEKLICLVLGAVLAWYLFSETKRAKTVARERAAAVTNEVAQAAAETMEAAVAAAAEPAQAESPPASVPSVPERLVTLENDAVKLELSTWGAVVRRVTLKKYAQDRGPLSEENPPVVLDFSASPLGAGEAVTAFEVAEQTDASVLFRQGAATRRITLGEKYQIVLEDAGAAAKTLSLGAMRMGVSKNDLLSVDSLVEGPKGPEPIHHCEGKSPLKDYLVGGLSGGCSGSKNAAGLPPSVTVEVPGRQRYVALKNRFFVAALVSTTDPNEGFSATVSRNLGAANYRPESVAAVMRFGAAPATRTSVFYVGPKKQSLLWDLGMKDVMEFGMWRWLCYPIVWILNLCHGVIPNFGVAIIILTILVRLVFWPLTHKSTVGMKKMQEIQPLMKELQAKYKDNPQRLQQEVWALYREKKVNPMSSCLPMLIQIPVFIALFNVLRSAVELRYAPFLWIGDLSEPEALFASWFPFGGLNILPILMAATMALQSALTPSTGDKNQQKMMMVFMPVMMLFMFYSFPSALSLYWTLSQVLSIWQMYLIRHPLTRIGEK